jgi:hypothetical protein
MLPLLLAISMPHTVSPSPTPPTASRLRLPKKKRHRHQGHLSITGTPRHLSDIQTWRGSPGTYPTSQENSRRSPRGPARLLAALGGGGWPGGLKYRGDCGVSQRGGFGKLVLYCFRGGGAGWVEPRVQSCPRAEEWCGGRPTSGVGRSATSGRNRIAKACRVYISAEDVAVAEKRTGVLNKVEWPKCNFSRKPYREGVSHLDFRRRCRRSQTKVVCRGGERWWCDGRVEDVDATTQNRAKCKKEQPETEHRDAYTRVHRANVPLEQTRAKSVVFWWT